MDFYFIRKCIVNNEADVIYKYNFGYIQAILFFEYTTYKKIRLFLQDKFYQL